MGDTTPDVRVYFVGSHGVGKSTLARWAAEEFGLPLVHEVASEVLTHYRPRTFDQLRVDVAAVSGYQRDVWCAQVNAEKEREGGFVSDRTALDSLGYMSEHADGLSAMLTGGAFSEYVETLRRAGVVIFHVRPHGETCDPDTGRAVSDASVISQHRIDAVLTYMLQATGLRYVSLADHCQRDRQNVVREVVRREIEIVGLRAMRAARPGGLSGQ